MQPRICCFFIDIAIVVEFGRVLVNFCHLLRCCHHCHRHRCRHGQQHVPITVAATHPNPQLSLLMVVKESFKLYKAVSEGVINLADTFFEMSHLDAAKGLEIYKQYTAFTDLLQTYYTQVDQIEEIRSSLKQPLDFHLATPPPEFLAQMEEYVREAPRALEDGSVAPAPTKISPLRRGQHSSRTGQRPSSGMGHHNDPGMVFPPGGGAPIGSQELSSPREEAVAPAAVAGEIDLLALDFEQEVAVDTVRVCLDLIVWVQ